jgi:hypothetical protein
MQHTSLMVVDIETVPDGELHEGDGFPILPFHQVVAIGFLEATIERSDQGETRSSPNVSNTLSRRHSLRPQPEMRFHKKILEWQAEHPNITWVGWGIIWAIVLALLFWPSVSE